MINIENKLYTEGLAKLVGEAKQEAKHCRKQDVEPFLGTDEEYAKAFEAYKAFVKANSLDDARYIPEPFTKKQLKISSAGDLLDADIQPRKLMLAPWFKVGDATMIYAPAGLGFHDAHHCYGGCWRWRDQGAELEDAGTV